MRALVPKEQERHMRQQISKLELDNAEHSADVKTYYRKKMRHLFENYVGDGAPWSWYHEIEYYDSDGDYIIHWKENPFNPKYWEERQAAGDISGLLLMGG